MDPRRLTHIDGLRGIAVVAVLLQHIGEIVIHAGLPWPRLTAMLGALLLDYGNAGRFGVVLFFLVSGFVIPFSLRGATPLRDFAIGRAVRLYPALWVSIAIAVVVLAATGAPTPTTAQTLTNALMVQPMFGQAEIVGAYWTLFIELIFYLLAAILYASGVLQRLRALAQCSVALLAIAAASGASLPAFLATMLLGTAWRRSTIDGTAAPAGLSLAHLIALPVVAPGLAATVSAALALGLFVLVVHGRPKFGGAMLFFGRISYSLYLIHGVVLIATLRWLAPRGDWPSTGVFVATTVLGSVAAATLLFRHIERPGMKYGRRPHRTAADHVALVAA